MPERPVEAWPVDAPDRRQPVSPAVPRGLTPTFEDRTEGKTGVYASERHAPAGLQEAEIEFFRQARDARDYFREVLRPA